MYQQNTNEFKTVSKYKLYKLYLFKNTENNK